MTMTTNNKKSRYKYWATRSSVCSSARTTHSFSCFALLALPVCSATLSSSLPHYWDSERLDGYFCSGFFFLFWTIVPGRNNVEFDQKSFGQCNCDKDDDNNNDDNNNNDKNENDNNNNDNDENNDENDNNNDNNNNKDNNNNNNE